MADLSGIITHKIEFSKDSPAGAPVDMSAIKELTAAIKDLTKKESTRNAQTKDLAEESKQNYKRERLATLLQVQQEKRRGQESSVEGAIERERVKGRNAEAVHQQNMIRAEQNNQLKKDFAEFRQQQQRDRAFKILMTGSATGAVTSLAHGVVSSAITRESYLGSAPYLNANQQASAAVNTQAQIQTIMANAIKVSATSAGAGIGAAFGTAILPGLGTAIGAGIGTAVGYVGGTIQQAFTAKQTATEKGAVTLSTQFGRAYLSGALPQSTQMINTKFQGLNSGLAIPSSLQNMIKNGRTYEARTVLATNQATRKLGYNIPANDAAIKTLYNMSLTGIDINKVLPGASLMASRSGQSLNSTLLGLLGFSRSTGIPTETAAPQISSLITQTGLSTTNAAEKFISTTRPQGAAFEQAALGYYRMTPLQQFSRTQMLKAFAPSVDPSAFFGGNKKAVKKAFDYIESRNGNLAAASVEQQLAGGSAQDYWAYKDMVTGQSVAGSGKSEANRNNVPMTEKSVQQGVSEYVKEAVKEITKNLKVRNMTVDKFEIAENPIRYGQ